MSGRGGPTQAVTNYSRQRSPSWWINVYCATWTDPHSPWDECILIRSCAPCRTLIIIFIDALQAGWWSGHMCSETITWKHGLRSLSRERNLVLHRFVLFVLPTCILHTRIVFQITHARSILFFFPHFSPPLEFFTCGHCTPAILFHWNKCNLQTTFIYTLVTARKGAGFVLSSFWDSFFFSLKPDKSNNHRILLHWIYSFLKAPPGNCIYFLR